MKKMKKIQRDASTDYIQYSSNAIKSNCHPQLVQHSLCFKVSLVYAEALQEALFRLNFILNFQVGESHIEATICVFWIDAECLQIVLNCLLVPVDKIECNA